MYINHIMKFLVWSTVVLFFFSCTKEEIPNRPNVVMIMCDDLGWGDTGFNGNKIVKTPYLDLLASKGTVFNRFYTASPVCSPTRASCLTGRNPYRMNIPTANSGQMKTEEVTLAEVLRKNNYHTGHFGKWHLGTFTTKIVDSNRGRPGNYREFSIPSQHGFDEFFSTEAKVPTYDPMIKPKLYNEKIGESPRFGWGQLEESDSVETYGTFYWNKKENRVKDSLIGDDAAIIMDQALEFIQRKSASENPFFVVIWLHNPHLPVVADFEHRQLYKELGFKEQLYYGSISAMDDQVGRLWQTLEELQEDKNTMLWFCSDNGPENGTPGSSGPFRGRKRSLYEGGVRVPSFVVWDNNITQDQTIDFPMTTGDYMPTILDMLSINHHLSRPIDGTSTKQAIFGAITEREKPMGFMFRQKRSWVTQQYKLISLDEGETFELYDLLNDPEEQNNIADERVELVNSMKGELSKWMISVNNSRTGGDY